jgi:16S rRNA (adenine1518-N6/adenine1519-N6)-dimethyltransferase
MERERFHSAIVDECLKKLLQPYDGVYAVSVGDLASRIRHFCSEQGIRLNTDLGQHFLTDQSVLDSIIDAARLTLDDRIVEIGPGIGVLTRELLEHTPHVTCIEIDERFPRLIEAYIRRDNRGLPMPEIILNNALDVPFPQEPYKIVANIPYHITSPLLRHAFLESARQPTALTLLIQREVAEKICDQHDRGLLTIIVGLFGNARIVRHVPPSCFLPPPKVDSSVLHIDCYSEPKADTATIERVMRIAKHAFAGKRKMLRNTMANLEGGTEALAKAGIDSTRRPQTLSVEEWIEVARNIAS